MSQGAKQAPTISFSLSEPEYDPKTYAGRAMALYSACNMKYAFYPNSRILKMRDSLKAQEAREAEQQKRTGSPHVQMTEAEVRELRRAQKVCSSAIHPDTGEIIPWAARFSSFIPCNMPIAFGFIYAAPTPVNTIFFQWLNQSYNAFFNYGNRNATSKVTNRDIFVNYLIAVSSSVSVGLALRKGFDLMGLTKGLPHGPKLYLLNTVSSVLASMSAGYINLFAMRRGELKTGIELTNEDGDKSFGKSCAAAKKAVMSTAMTRVYLALPLFIPAMGLIALEKARMMPQGNVLKTTVEMSLIYLELRLAIPFAVAIFPSQGAIKAEMLEENFRAIKDEQGNEVRVFYYNKGI